MKKVWEGRNNVFPPSCTSGYVLKILNCKGKLTLLRMSQTKRLRTGEIHVSPSY